MFTAIGIYTERFEKPFLECTSEFYASEGVKYMQESDVPDYLKHVEVRSSVDLSCFSGFQCLHHVSLSLLFGRIFLTFFRASHTS